jgi:hypothetical protein
MDNYFNLNGTTTYTGTVEKPQDDKTACLMILKARIKDLRNLEKYLSEMRIKFDKEVISKKIGGLRKCIDYIKNH